MFKLFLLTAVIASLLSGCLTSAPRDVRYAAAYVDEDATFKQLLLAELRKELLVSNDGEVIQCESGPHAIPSKGLFGLGPSWQELIRFRIEIVPRVSRRLSVTGETVLLQVAGGPKVQVVVSALHRQGPGFEWQLQPDGPTNTAIETRVLQVVQRVATLGSKA